MLSKKRRNHGVPRHPAFHASQSREAVPAPIEQARSFQMFITTHANDETYVITLRGQFGHKAKSGLEVAILGAQEARAKHIILEFSEVSWIDSAGLGKLLLTYHHLNRKRVAISIVNPKPDVREILELVDIPRLVPIYSSIEEAMHASSVSTRST